MSKISQLNAELEQQAYDLGYESLGEAIEKGCMIDYKKEKLLTIDDVQKIAHEAWLEEKKVILGDLRNLLTGMSVAGKSDTTEFGIVKRAIEFIQKGEM